MSTINKKNVRNIIGWVLVFELMGYFIGQITQKNIALWYPTLHKSILTPPSIVFPIVWSILYAMIALSGWSIWQHRHNPGAKTALTLYTIQVILNWSWSVLFFNFHQIGYSLYCIILITFDTLLLILLTRKYFKFSSMMLVPYFIWLVFASYLNGIIWLLN